MANPQPNEHTRLSNELYGAMMQTDFSKRQLKIINLIIRTSYGCGKKSAILRQIDFCIIGIDKSDIKKELDYLKSTKVLFIDGEEYTLNKNYDEWRVSLVKQYDRKKFDEIIHRNLEHKRSIQNANQSVGKTPTEAEKEVGKIPTDDKKVVGKIPTITLKNRIRLVKHQPRGLQNTNQPVGKIPTDTACETSNGAGSELPKESIKESIKYSLLFIFNSCMSQEEKFVRMLKEIKNYPFEENLDKQLFRYLDHSFPKVDIVDCTKSWLEHFLDNELDFGDKARTLLKGWVNKASDLGLNKRKRSSETKVLMPAPQKGEIHPKGVKIVEEYLPNYKDRTLNKQESELFSINWTHLS